MAEQNKRNLVKMLLLGFVTLGIYWLYWIYKVTQLSNHVKTLPERSPVAQLFLCMLVPFYDIYWYYQTSKRVDVMMASVGHPSDSGILTILLTFFTGPVFASLFLPPHADNEIIITAHNNTANTFFIQLISFSYAADFMQYSIICNFNVT